MEIEKKILAFEEGKYKHILLQTPTTNQNVSDVDDNISPRRFDITLVDPNVKLLGNYSEVTNGAEIPRLTQPLCLSDWKHFIDQKYEMQTMRLYTLIVSQNVINAITAEVLNVIKQKGVQSIFLHIK